MEQIPTLLLMIGESGSGKSTIAKALESKNFPNVIRLNRDEMRVELKPLFPNARSGEFEKEVIKTQIDRALQAISAGIDVIIDDTNLNPKTVEKWKNIVHGKAEFKTFVMNTALDLCISRDASRAGTAKVGRAVIERQFLLSGRLPLDKKKDIVIVDIDGTIATHTGIRSPFDESKVHLDLPYQGITSQIRVLSKNHTVIVVSGRHSTCGQSTIQWLDKHEVPFDHIFMRHAWDNRSDVIVKQEILDQLLKLVDKDRIKVVYDDRKRVIDMWIINNLNVKFVKQGRQCNYEDLEDF